MSKAVLISIQPKWCELIASGKKTVEVRKTGPNIDVPFKCYIYCTRFKKGKLIWKQGNKFLGYKLTDVNGKVIGEFVCDAVFPMSIEYSNPESRLALKEFPYTCLTDKEIMDYLGNGKTGYGWHISNLIIYDKPKELSEFFKRCDEGCEDCDFWKYVRVNADEYDMDCSSPLYEHVPITRPPQSWCYVEDQTAQG